MAKETKQNPELKKEEEIKGSGEEVNQDTVVKDKPDYIKRLIEEYKDLGDKRAKLVEAFGKPDFKDKVGEYQYQLLIEQLQAMDRYYSILQERLYNLGEEI